MKFRFEILFIFSLAFFYSSLSSQSYSIKGQVFDEKNNPVVDAQLLIEDLNQTVFTNEQGIFLLEGLSAGKHRIDIYHVGFVSQTITFTPPFPIDSLVHIVLQFKEITLEKMTVTTTRLKLDETKISSPVNIVSSEAIQLLLPASSAEVLREETGIAVQKTNHGGGSAIIRGLSSSRILIMVDGIRLNNSIYRLGNHQYLTTIDPMHIERMEVLRGPGSVLYGSDALGGVINVQTTGLSLSQKQAWQSNIQAVFSSADNSKRGHFNFRYSASSGAFWLGTSYKSFGDLRRGTNGGNQFLEKSTNGVLQSPSGFDTGNIDFKAMYSLNKKSKIIFAYQYNRQWDVPRYDKYENDGYYLWTYEPQERQLAYLRLQQRINSPWLNRFETTISYHLQGEGRKIQKNIDSDKEIENDQAGSLGMTAHVVGAMGQHLYTLGFDSYLDNIHSTRLLLSPDNTLLSESERGRYPDQSKYWSGGLFAEDQWQLNNRLNINIAGRFSVSQVNFPTDSSEYVQRFQAFTFNGSLIYEVIENLFLDVGLRQGFRAPNLSDLSKLGESKGNTYEIPNTDLVPEKLLGLDLGMKYRSKNLQSELFFYFSHMSDLISSAPAVINGMNQIEIGGEFYDLRSKQNIGMGNIYGVEWGMNYFPYSQSFGFNANIVWAYGQNVTLDEPMNTIPPLIGKFGINTIYKSIKFNLFSRFASAQTRLSEDDLQDSRIQPGGTPGWVTLNFRGSGEIFPGTSLVMGLENIFDLNYREHGSGINAPGRNFYVSFHILVMNSK